MQRSSAKILSKKQLEFVPNQVEKCRIVEGEHQVLVLTQQKRKSFFRSDNRMVEEVLIDLSEIPEGDFTLELPPKNGKACYKAGMHMITFLDFSPKGNLTLEKKNGIITGSVDLELSDVWKWKAWKQKEALKWNFKSTINGSSGIG